VDTKKTIARIAVIVPYRIFTLDMVGILVEMSVGNLPPPEGRG
jgi:hypothetical protein